MIDRIRVVSGLAINADNRILVAKRPISKIVDGKQVQVKRPEMYEYPGGKVERAEGDERALEREWFEELQVKVTVKNRIARITFDLESPVVISLYRVVLGDQIPKPTEHTDLRWVDPQYAVEYLPAVPSLYLFYPQVKAAVRALAVNALR
jgi:8-oxo-dGTP diphosphatase